MCTDLRWDVTREQSEKEYIEVIKKVDEWKLTLENLEKFRWYVKRMYKLKSILETYQKWVL